jgi:hypothetical protein
MSDAYFSRAAIRGIADVVHRSAGDAAGMATALQPRREEFHALSTHWRLALDTAQTALEAAPEVLPAEALQGRMSLLAAERAATAQLLQELAHDLRVEAWLSDLAA